MEAPQKTSYVSTWKKPEPGPNSYRTGLMVNNTLNYDGKLVEFIPKEGRQVKWYMCGPTVYADSHLGHARTYISFDAIRRTLRDYFNYEVLLTMNITNIDDKIIIRSNEVNEEFESFARKWEGEFFQDMKALGNELPDVITRVSEFVPEIVAFIKKIIDNGFAYESEGSVYFDVPKYQAAGHTYAKLQPWSVGDSELQEEGEGKLAAKVVKKNDKDFALWKASKPGEPKWPSPWGEGRPGWHIECSVMCAETLGNTLDIHSGGIDLKFPHHDNEIAQTEAYFKSEQWINYFLHTGHLNINGLKMSKSLKNFISVKDFLGKYHPRAVRLLFLTHKYDSLMDFGDNSFDEAAAKDKRFHEFFLNAKSVLRTNPITNEQKWNKADFELQSKYSEARELIHKAFLNNFNFPGVIQEIDKLMTLVNQYLSTTSVKLPLVTSIVNHIQFSFKCIGLIYGDSGASGSAAQKQRAEEEAIIGPFVDQFAAFRDKVRTAAKAKEIGKVLEACDEVRDDILPNLGIRLEDRAIGLAAVWKYDDKEALLKEREAKMEERKAKDAEVKAKDADKVKKAEEAAKREKENQERLKLSPDQYFRVQTDKFSQFNEEGFPTHDNDGKEISKNFAKKLLKEWENHKEAHAKWLEANKKA